MRGLFSGWLGRGEGEADDYDGPPSYIMKIFLVFWRVKCAAQPSRGKAGETQEQEVLKFFAGSNCLGGRTNMPRGTAHGFSSSLPEP